MVPPILLEESLETGVFGVGLVAFNFVSVTMQ